MNKKIQQAQHTTQRIVNGGYLLKFNILHLIKESAKMKVKSYKIRH